jgi:hypothetical protein
MSRECHTRVTVGHPVIYGELIGFAKIGVTADSGE